MYWTIRAWGSYLTSRNIAHGQALSLADVEHVMNLQYQREDGDLAGGQRHARTMVVNLCLIDSGYDTDILVGGQRYKLGSRSLTRADLGILRQMRNELLAQENAGDSGRVF